MSREEILAAVEVQGGWAAGSRSAVYLPVDGAGVRRVPWELVERAEWNADDSAMHLWETAPFGTPMRRTDLVVDDPGPVRPTGPGTHQRERPDPAPRAHIGQERCACRGPAEPCPEARPEVTWNLVLDDGVDPDQPGVLDRPEMRHCDRCGTSSGCSANPIGSGRARPVNLIRASGDRARRRHFPRSSIGRAVRLLTGRLLVRVHVGGAHHRPLVRDLAGLQPLVGHAGTQRPQPDGLRRRVVS